MRKRPLRSARRHVICIEEKRTAPACAYQETICIDFKMDKHRTKQMLWEAIGIVPTASLLIQNKSSEKALFLINRLHAPEVSLQVEAHAQVAMTVTHVVKISSVFARTRLHEDAICYGILSLHLQSPQIPSVRQHVEKSGELAIKRVSPAHSIPPEHQVNEIAILSTPPCKLDQLSDTSLSS